MSKEKDTVILPKGTLVFINGFRAELLRDTKVISPTIKEVGGLKAKEYDFIGCPCSTNVQTTNKDEGFWLTEDRNITSLLD